MTADPTIPEQLAQVKEYLRAGLSVIPVKADGTKAPAFAGWRRYASRQPTPQEVWAWFGPDAVTRYGIGIPGGPASGNLAVLDFEAAAAWDCWLREVPSDTADYLDDCPLCRTPGGGAHLYVRLPDPAAGVKLARDAAGKTLVEVRGDNHQVVAPGSPKACHPTGRLYWWERKGWVEMAPGSVPPVPHSVWADWVALACSMNEFKEPDRPKPERRPRDDRPTDGDPGRDFNVRGAWDDTGLFEAGWRWVRELDGDRGLVRRPGKAEGQSGTLGVCNSKANGWPLFHCFTSNGYPFDQDGSYDRFGVFARLKHRGDFSAATKALLAMGYGTPRKATGTRPRPEPPAGGLEAYDSAAPAPDGEAPPPEPDREPDDPPDDPGPPAAAPVSKERKSRFAFRDSDEFLAGDYRPRWLVPRVLVRGQPGVIAGPSKGMKTSLLVDLAVSIATATPFLGQFPVRERVRVAVVSGESGEFTLKETCLRVLASKGLAPAALSGWLKWEFNLPTFSDVASMLDFGGHLARTECDVVIIDPTYLALGDVDAKNLFEMGAALRTMADVLRAARPDLTVILVHHANRLLPAGEVMELQHLAYSGLEQYARQFFLLNRREPYKNDGVHDIWLRVGGSTGHGGLWAVHIDEGLVGEDFAGRRWDVTVSTPAEADDAGRKAADRKRVDQARERDRLDEEAVMLAIDAEAALGNPGASVSLLGDKTGLHDRRVRAAADRLLERGAVVWVAPFARASGHGARVTVNKGLGRPPPD